MSRVPIPRVELFSDGEAPNLETLTPRPETVRWLQAQQFEFARLNTKKIIEILAGLAHISKKLWRYKPESNGSINVHDCVEIDGPVIKRKFNLKLVRIGSNLHLTVVLEQQPIDRNGE